MATIWRRMDNHKSTKNWRHVYKSLLLLDNLIRNGSDQVITEIRIHLFSIERLSNYNASEGLKDVGQSGLLFLFIFIYFIFIFFLFFLFFFIIFYFSNCYFI